MKTVFHSNFPILCFYFSNQTHRARWPPRPWAHPHPTEECTRLCLAQPPWGPPALFTLLLARWVRPWTAWRHPSPSSVRQWALTPWTRPAWATAPASARRWGLWQTHKKVHSPQLHIQALCLPGSFFIVTTYRVDKQYLFLHFSWHLRVVAICR